MSQQVLGDLSISYSAFPSGDSGRGNDCVTCSTPIVDEKFPWLQGCWAAGLT